MPPTEGLRRTACLNRFSCAMWSTFWKTWLSLSSRYQWDLKPSNESLEVFIARPVAARRANQAGAWKGTYDNALLGEAVDKRLRLVGSPGDQGRLVRLGDYVGAMLQEQRSAAWWAHVKRSSPASVANASEARSPAIAAAGVHEPSKRTAPLRNLKSGSSHEK